MERTTYKERAAGKCALQGGTIDALSSPQECGGVNGSFSRLTAETSRSLVGHPKPIPEGMKALEQEGREAQKKYARTVARGEGQTVRAFPASICGYDSRPFTQRERPYVETFAGTL